MADIMVHISDGIETEKGTKTYYTKDEFFNDGHYDTDTNKDNFGAIIDWLDEQQRKQYTKKCGECSCTLTINTPIMCYRNVDRTETLCKNCYWECEYWKDDDNPDNEEEINDWNDELALSGSPPSDSDDEEFNEWCEKCNKKMSDKKLTEEEYDEHPDRDIGYDYSTGESEWLCRSCRPAKKKKIYLITKRTE